jgi:hypothetical protein
VIINFKHYTSQSVEHSYEVRCIFLYIYMYIYIYILNLINAWMSWIKCTTIILGAQQIQQISKMILDFFSGVLYVSVIYSAQIHTVIICIAMEVFAIAPNGLDRLLYPI